MSYRTRYEVVDTIYRHAIARLVVAIAGQKVPREPYSRPINDAGYNLVKAFEAGAVYKPYQWLVDKKADDAITSLVEALIGENVAGGPYSDDVYWAAAKFVYAYRAKQEMQNCRITDFDEYWAERERLRQIGLTIDPATAETTWRYEDLNDPYDILDEEYHEGQVGREYFARNPGGEWVYCGDLPEATSELLWPTRRTIETEALVAEFFLLSELATAKSVEKAGLEGNTREKFALEGRDGKSTMDAVDE